ncbi:MAG: hypothetical protein RIM99_19140 [Cyclobacteriaceae bacterium]
MKTSTKSTIRIVSILLALLLVLMEIDLIPNIINYHFWVLIIAYAMLAFTLRK